MKIIGLTGGIGCGKSTVGQILERDFGLPRVDADEIARFVVEPDQPAFKRLSDRFGPTILDAHGALDRAELARLAFATDENRRALEAITHPAIAAETGQRLQQLRRAGHSLSIYEVPLLFEVGRQSMCDEVVAVVASAPIQWARIMARGAISQQDAQRRIDAQWPNDKKVALADVTINNDGDISELKDQVVRLVERWRARGWLASD